MSFGINDSGFLFQLAILAFFKLASSI